MRTMETVTNMIRRKIHLIHRASGKRWPQSSLLLLVIPMVIVSSCAGLPDTSGLTPQDASERETVNAQAYYHFLRGSLAELEQDHTRARNEYRLALDHDPGSVFLKVKLAKLHFSAGEMASALDWADRVSNADTLGVADLVQLAKIYAGAGKPDRALELFDRAIDHAETTPEEKARSLVGKGVLLMNLNRYAEAKEVFAQSIKVSPSSYVGYYYLGRVLGALNDLEGAKHNYEQSIERAPSFEPGYRALGQLLEQENNPAAAIEVYRRFLEQDSRSSHPIRQQLVKLLLRQGDFEQALEQLDVILNGNPHDVNAQVRKALVLGEMGQLPQAIEQLTAIVQARPQELKVRDYLGLLHEEAKDFDKAIQVYKRNVELDPTFYDSQFHLGYLLYRLKRYPESLPYLQQAETLMSDKPEPSLILGLVYMQMENYAMAVETFERAVARHPEHADLRFNLGAAYDKVDRFSDVVKQMETVLQLNPDHADALNYLGYSYAERGIHLDEAVRLTRRAVELQPKNGYYIDSLGWALFQVGKIDEALQRMKEAAALVQDDPVIYEHLGAIYLKQEKREEAEKAWKQAIQLDSSNTSLIQRFHEEGFGEIPTNENTASQEPQVTHAADPTNFP